jgi:soluble lytic murein transglycosylase
MVIVALLAGLALAPANAAVPRKAPSKKAVVIKPPARKPVPFKPAARPPETPADVQFDADLQKTAALAQSSDPVARKLTTWLYVTGTRLPVDARQLIAFATANPGWPRMDIFRQKTEQTISASLTAADIAAWFTQNPPETASGIKAYIGALQSLGETPRAREALSAFWRTETLGRNETASLAATLKNYFAPGDHAARLDNLIWEGRYGEAQYMLAFVDAGTRALGQARIALGRMAKNAPALVDAVPANLQNDEGLLFERLRWRRRRNMDAGALEIINALPASLKRPDPWWGEINVMVRRAIEKKDFAGAYSIAQKHTLADGVNYAQAEWMLGWLALRRLNQPTEAYRRFDNLYRKVSSAISHSRAAFWAARAAEALPDHTLAGRWYKVAAQYPSTFYGQLSYQKLYGTPKPDAFREADLPAETWAQFSQRDTVRAVRILHGMKLGHLTDPFFARLIADAATKQEFMMIARLARETERYYYAVQANKDIQQRLGQFLFWEGYPTLPPLPAQTPEKSLVHAIIHRESMFNPLAESPVGARGLMQLMPPTAKAVARAEGETYNLKKLTADPRYNVLIGSAYLRDLVHDYRGFYPMAIAAYNAGPGNVSRWISEIGDPRAGEVDVLDWIESIPIYETRNYIQRVMESYYIYRLRFGEEPKTIFDFMQKG